MWKTHYKNRHIKGALKWLQSCSNVQISANYKKILAVCFSRLSKYRKCYSFITNKMKPEYLVGIHARSTFINFPEDSQATVFHPLSARRILYVLSFSKDFIALCPIEIVVNRSQQHRPELTLFPNFYQSHLVGTDGNKNLLLSGETFIMRIFSQKINVPSRK